MAKGVTVSVRPKKSIIAKSKLAKAMMADAYFVESPKHCPFRPTVDYVEKWFAIINKEVFSGQLRKPDKIEVRRRHKCWAETGGYVLNEDGQETVVINLSINHRFKSHKHFLSVLAHECVHIYEYLTGQTMGHGQNFLAWGPKLAKFGVQI